MTEIQFERLRLACQECALRKRQADLILASKMRHLARQLEKPARPSTAQILQAALLDEEASDFLTTGAPIDTKALLSSLKDMEEDDA